MKRFHQSVPGAAWVCLIFVIVLPRFGFSARSETVRGRAPHVIVINSYHRGYLWSDRVLEGIAEKFRESGRLRINTHYEYMDAKRHFSGPYGSYALKLRELMRLKYLRFRPDLVIVSDTPAYSFMKAHRKYLFPGVPVVFCGVEKNGEDPGMTGIISGSGHADTIGLIRRVLPLTKRIIFITDSTATGKVNRAVLEQAGPESAGAEIVFPESEGGLSAEELLDYAASLGEGDVIYYSDFFRDRDGHYVDSMQFIPLLAEIAAVPVFYHADTFLGLGVLGGYMSSPRKQGRRAAELALKILGGEPVSSIPVEVAGERKIMFDYDQIKRFGISLSSLPPGSNIVNMPEKLFEKYREPILVLLAFAAFMGVVTAVLLMNIRSRKRSEAKYRSLFESAGDGIFYMKGLEIIECNEKACEILQRPESEILGKRPADLSPEYQPDGRRSTERGKLLVGRALEGEPQFFQWVHSRGDGTSFYAEVSLKRFFIRGEYFLQAIIRDIDSKMRIEEQLNKAQRMDIVGQLAGGVAHDFNNMLGGIMGNAELLSIKIPEDSPLHKHVKMIISSVENASGLTQKLLDFSSKGEVSLESMDIHEAVRGAVTLLQRSMDRPIDIVTSFAAANPYIVGDSVMVENALLNLGVNARDAMPDGGTLTYSTVNVDLDEQFCRNYPFSAAPGKYIEIGVSDTGEGMTSEVSDRAFEPFFTTRPVGKGVGLGLSAVYGMVKDHRGLINLYSEEGIGTVIKIYLPLDAGSSHAGDVKKETVYAGTGTILIVDDEPLVLRTASAQLASIGYEVIVAGGGKEALEIYRERRHEISLVILDMIMPEMPGREVFLKLLEEDPEVKVVFSSGFNRDSGFSHMISLGARGFIQKPYRLASLSRAAALALGKLEE